MTIYIRSSKKSRAQVKQGVSAVIHKNNGFSLSDTELRLIATWATEAKTHNHESFEGVVRRAKGKLNADVNRNHEVNSARCIIKSDHGKPLVKEVINQSLNFEKWYRSNFERNSPDAGDSVHNINSYYYSDGFVEPAASDSRPLRHHLDTRDRLSFAQLVPLLIDLCRAQRYMPWELQRCLPGYNPQKAQFFETNYDFTAMRQADMGLLKARGSNTKLSRHPNERHAWTLEQRMANSPLECGPSATAFIVLNMIRLVYSTKHNTRGQELRNIYHNISQSLFAFWMGAAIEKYGRHSATEVWSVTAEFCKKEAGQRTVHNNKDRILAGLHSHDYNAKPIRCRDKMLHRWIDYLFA
ncbi:MAG: hypothetical protein GY862_21135 [Gammaproteobacteria bacterium]|nr:hypothetical protein [Gammaproteobacteria bacterium]